jgi:prepilin-type N-terminal cleavage/methylation domain-containing protein
MHSSRSRDRGFTLVEILIAIVVVGILAAVVVVGVSALTSKSGSAACTASLDAAKSASIVHYTNTGAFPTTFTDMTAATPPNPAELTLPAAVTVDATGLIASGSNWSLTLTPGAAGVAPTFTCGAGGAGGSGGGNGFAAPATTAATPTTVASNGTAACPGTFSGWVGEYYSNQNLTGSPTICRDDASLTFHWGSGSPQSGFPSDHFSGRWTKTVTFTAGSHAFTLGSDDGGRLYIDGTRVIDSWFDRAYATDTVSRTLTAGTHTIVMEFYENGGLADATLTWT